MRILLLFFIMVGLSAQGQSPWKLHVIDNSSSGADGVKLADINNDGRHDIVTGWEEGGITKLYLQPKTKFVKEKWPVVVVGNTPDVEDAVFADLDKDGDLDVLICEENFGENSKGLGVVWYENPVK